jgi:hypothetical protein
VMREGRAPGILVLPRTYAMPCLYKHERNREEPTMLGEILRSPVNIPAAGDNHGLAGHSVLVARQQ